MILFSWLLVIMYTLLKQIAVSRSAETKKIEKKENERYENNKLILMSKKYDVSETCRGTAKNTKRFPRFISSDTVYYFYEVCCFIEV